jgi:hypothetical protein
MGNKKGHVRVALYLVVIVILGFSDRPPPYMHDTYALHPHTSSTQWV